jgi:hypothetical protein
MGRIRIATDGCAVGTLEFLSNYIGNLDLYESVVARIESIENQNPGGTPFESTPSEIYNFTSRKGSASLTIRKNLRDTIRSLLAGQPESLENATVTAFYKGNELVGFR